LNNRVQILLSTYNGRRWIPEFLESIAHQGYADIRLFIRDDGSTDTTVEYLKSHLDRFPGCKVEYGRNIGVYKSFMYLLKEADASCSYYAFADQDDIWKSDKITRAVESLRTCPPNQPAIYYSRLEFVDEHLKHLGYSPIPAQRGFHTALVQNQATGCTVVINSAARNLILESIPEWSLMHDWWCFLVVSAFGHVIYDSQPAILYRKHGANITPSSPHMIAELINRTRRFFKVTNVPGSVSDQALEFFNRYGHKLDNRKKGIIAGLLAARSGTFFNRLLYSMTMPVRRNTPFDTLLMRFLIIIGRF